MITSVDRIDDQHFPGLFQSADQASLSAQKRYLVFQKSHLGLLVLASITSVIIPVVSAPYLEWAYGVLATFLTMGVILALLSYLLKNDRIWFDCRAIAESTKTVAWRFMMRVGPFEDDSTAKGQFVSTIREIREEGSSIAGALAEKLDPKSRPISDTMQFVRTTDLESRKSLYLGSRVRDQQAWYSSKASFNARRKSCWFWAATVLQIAAVLLAIIQAILEGFRVNVIPIITTCAAAAVAWSQMKRHGELAQTYAIAAQELGEQEAIALDLREESEFVSLVEQAEETISREHTMWCARREVSIKLNNKGG